MPNSKSALVAQLTLQSRLLKNVTADVSDSESLRQISPETNHIAWLTGHVYSTRCMLAGVLGSPVSEPFPALFENGKGVDTAANYPSMEALIHNWDSLSDSLVNALDNTPEEALENQMPRPVPTGDTLLDFVTFLVHHEAYHLGQMGILRRVLGKEAMKYS